MNFIQFDKKIKDFIYKEFKKNIKTDQNLLSTNIIDSVNAISLIIFLEKKLKIKIKKNMLNSKTFKNIKNMYKVFYN